ncbi:HYR domain-containing protein [Flavisolibacter tropicus]|uniref:HYR domain-containing protein n=1 Tax=Flavisolibacter tropicus TaxID=1492898 RepID=A0A172TVZ4_9BACT|nr:HYR domain-containing protein [Flavisolibacter tropicus]ANE51281.1 hypothetical protein SY85_12935 [Flavisolibacter tropicus]
MKTFLLRCPLLLLAVFMTSLALSQNCSLSSLGNIVVPAEKGKSGAVVTLPDVVTACGKITYTRVPATPTFPIGVTTTFPIGVTTVKAESANGRTTKEFTVTVLDAEPPVITTPDPLFLNTDAGACSASSTNLRTPTVSDNTAIIVGTRSDKQSITSSYPKGTTIITWSATDAAGNQATTTQLVVVSDKQAPVMVLPFDAASITKNTDADVCSYTVKGSEFDASATDNCGQAAISYSWSGACSGKADNSLAGTVFAKGTTTVWCTATDADGNTSEWVFDIVVADKQVPVMKLPFTDASISKNTDADVCSYTVIGPEFDASATDNCAGAVTISYSWSGACSGNADNSLAGSVFAKGTTTVWCKATDGDGNVAEWTFDIAVADKQAPVMVLPFDAASITKNTDADVCSYTVKGSEFDASATDNCGQAAISYSWSGACSGKADNSLAGTVFAKGTTTVWCTATDASGNKSYWTFDISVEDRQAPVINSVRATPDVLWAPNHKMTDITLTYDVAENCSGLTFQVLSITSNESENGLGDGNTNVDWDKGTDGQHIQLRAERSGTGTDRIYSIVLQVTDGSGNKSEPITVTVTVPHDQGKKEEAETQKSLSMVVAPNPSQNNFTIKATSENTTDKITMIVSDSMGRPVYRKNNITPGQVITMGSDLQPGSYFVVLQQGNQTTQQQIIKIK